MSRPVPFALVGLVAVASLLAAGLVLSLRSAQALPPAGVDFLIVSASVEVESRLGQETIGLAGTANIQRGTPRLEDGVEVQNLTVLALELEGPASNGTVTVSQSPTRVSVGEVRSKTPGVEFPASSYLDVFFDADVPASPSHTSPLTLHNQNAIRLLPTVGNINIWPPAGVTYAATLDPCLPLFPRQPAEVCVNALSVTILESAPGNPTYAVRPGGPSGFHPADLFALSAVATPTPSPTQTPFGAPTATPTPTITPTPMPVAGNDDFADAVVVDALPFASKQDTSGATVQPGEPLTEDETDPLNQQCFGIPNVIGNTVWFRFTPSTSGLVTVNTVNSNFDTVLGVYTGNAVDALTLVACNDDPEGLALQARVTFDATAGTLYHIQAGGFAAVSGNLNLSITQAGGGSSLPSSGVAAGAGFEVSSLITCVDLGLSADGCDDGTDGTQDSIDALSYGSDFTPNELELVFSVAAGSQGLAGTAVATQAACSPPEPQADEFATQLDGGNVLLFDGNGVNGDCPTSASLGLIEGDPADDLDALTDQPPSVVDTNEDGTPDAPIFFSLDPASPSLTALGSGPADILYSLNGDEPLVFASAADLGLQAGDDIDAVCLDNGDGDLTYSSAADTLYFSLAAGSPTLTGLGASAADILAPGVAVVHEAATLGLQTSDDVDALDCFVEVPPTPTPTASNTPTTTPTPPPVPGDGDVNKDGLTNAIDATILLQFAAGLVGTIHVDGDVNRDGRFTSIDATLILQFVAGFIPELPV